MESSRSASATRAGAVAAEDEQRIRARVPIRLRRLALLMDPERVHRLSLARAALAGRERPRDPVPSHWLDQRVDDAIRVVLATDREEERQGIVSEDGDGDGVTFLTQVLGIPPSLARLAAIRFNDLPIETRRPFVAVALGKGVDQCVREGLGSEEGVIAALRRSLRALGILDEGLPGRAGEARLSDSSSLEPSERELLRVYRHEVAYLLVRLCHYLAATDPRGGAGFARVKNADEVYAMPSLDSMSAHRRALLESRPTREHDDALALVSSCVSGGRAAALGQVAAASLRVAPSDEARIYGTAHLTNAGDLDAARRILGVVEHGPTARQVRLAALCAHGRIAYLLGDYHEAREEYRRASELDSASASALPFWLWNSLWSEHEEEALAAANAFDARFPPGHSIHADMRRLAQQERTIGRLPTADRRFAARLQDRIGESSTEVVDAVLA